jgi:hypothetical protein
MSNYSYPKYEYSQSQKDDILIKEPYEDEHTASPSQSPHAQDENHPESTSKDNDDMLVVSRPLRRRRQLAMSMMQQHHRHHEDDDDDQSIATTTNAFASLEAALLLMEQERPPRGQQSDELAQASTIVLAMNRSADDAASEPRRQRSSHWRALRDDGEPADVPSSPSTLSSFSPQKVAKTTTKSRCEPRPRTKPEPNVLGIERTDTINAWRQTVNGGCDPRDDQPTVNQRTEPFGESRTNAMDAHPPKKKAVPVTTTVAHTAKSIVGSR